MRVSLCTVAFKFLREYLQKKKQKLIAICFIYLCLSVCVCEKLREREI